MENKIFKLFILNYDYVFFKVNFLIMVFKLFGNKVIFYI